MVLAGIGGVGAKYGIGLWILVTLAFVLFIGWLSSWAAKRDAAKNPEADRDEGDNQ